MSSPFVSALRFMSPIFIYYSWVKVSDVEAEERDCYNTWASGYIQLHAVLTAAPPFLRICGNSVVRAGMISNKSHVLVNTYSYNIG